MRTRISQVTALGASEKLCFIFLVAEFFANQKKVNPVWNAGVTCIDKL